MLDELYNPDPEPCDECARGLMLFVSFDGVRRCRPCVQRYAAEHLWNGREIPEMKKRRRKKGDQVAGQGEML